MSTDGRSARDETTSALSRFAQNQEQQLTQLRELTDRKLNEVRSTLDEQAKDYAN